MEDIWRQRLVSLGWSQRAAQQIRFCRAKSTMVSYTYYIEKYRLFCEDNGLMFPPDPSISWIVADFLCSCADKCSRPASTLKTVSAAISSVYDALGEKSPMCNSDIQHLISALVKSGTSKPMYKTKVMPAEPFYSLFISWPDDHELSISDLRLKAITLLSLTIMARPSDLAPLAVYFNPESGSIERVVFKRSQLAFHDDGSLTIQLLGVKNDTQRTGFEIRIPESKIPKANVVATLRTYMDRTASGASDAVFVTLKPPYKAIKAESIRKVLTQAIVMAGLDKKGYTARSFRPTGANAALEAGCKPETVMHVGRWKTQDVFFQHYVYPRAPKDMSTNIAQFSGIHY